MHQIELALFHDGCVDLLAVLPCTISPLSHGSFIQPKCLHNRLHWTSIRQQRYHDDDEFYRLA